MAVEDKIGQMLLCGWSSVGRNDSATLNAHAAFLVDTLRVGGIILMGRNASPPNRLRATLTGMQQRANARGLPPLFVAIDQEGGRVQRLRPPGYALYPPAWEIGATEDENLARTTAAKQGRELVSVGICWNFAPVLDVNNNPSNPVIGTRSYGDDPQQAARMGTAAMRGMQEDAGILACGKHFPGHGDTDTDSHFALPRITRSREQLNAVELVPFQAAISAGIGAIMTAHILFPALDDALPATLSPAILTGLLREELGFNGLVITDDLEMKGVSSHWGAPEAAVLAVLAGADILLCCHTQATQVAVRDALVQAVQSGRIAEARLDQSARRIADAKARWLKGVA